jgi:hypothetical protein
MAVLSLPPRAQLLGWSAGGGCQSGLVAFASPASDLQSPRTQVSRVFIAIPANSSIIKFGVDLVGFSRIGRRLSFPTFASRGRTQIPACCVSIAIPANSRIIK